jgi:hypothetical protein
VAQRQQRQVFASFGLWAIYKDDRARLDGKCIQEPWDHTAGVCEHAFDIGIALEPPPRRIVLRASVKKSGVNGRDGERVLVIREVAGKHLRGDARGGAALNEMRRMHRLDGANEGEHLGRERAGHSIGQVRRRSEEARCCTPCCSDQHLRRLRASRAHA